MGEAGETCCAQDTEQKFNKLRRNLELIGIRPNELVLATTLVLFYNSPCWSLYYKHTFLYKWWPFRNSFDSWRHRGLFNKTDALTSSLVSPMTIDTVIVVCSSSKSNFQESWNGFFFMYAYGAHVKLLLCYGAWSTWGSWTRAKEISAWLAGQSGYELTRESTEG